MKRIKYVLLAIISPFIALTLYMGYIYIDFDYELKEIVEYNPPLTTQIYDTKGRLIANLYNKEHRLYIGYEDIPARLIESLLAIEDTSFFEHPGINIDAIFRAIIKDIKAGAMVEGASTLTQQLVRTVLLTREKKLSRKIKEVVLSLKLESLLTKEEILHRYINQIYLGHGYYGFRTASLGYFRKELDMLSLKEIAMLVSLPRSPNFYNPTKNLKYSLSRANNVVNRLKVLGWIEEEDFLNAINEIPTVYNDTLTQNVAPYVVDEIIRSMGENKDSIKGGGYTIHTTIDLEVQKMAKDALKYSYEKIKARDSGGEYTKTLNGAIIVSHPQTGDILALIGGVDYVKSSYNRATMAKRQVGSALKPFIYLKAIDLGYHPLSKVADISRIYSTENEDSAEDWKPSNYEGDFRGLITLEDAVVHSRNLATLNLTNEIGLSPIREFLMNIGFDNIPKNLSLSLGSFESTPLNMIRAYSIFPNYGEIYEPRIIKSIENKNKKKYTFDIHSNRLVSRNQTYLIVDTLKKVVTSGTGRKVKTPGLSIAGKTGTTNQNKDGWFCGFTPTLEVVTWFGNDENTPMRKSETGASVGATAFKHFINAYLQRFPQTKREFDIPQDVQSRIIHGEKLFFTDKSPLPNEKSNSMSDIDNELLF